MSDRPLCLLALDGGGIRGLSELIILEEIMRRVKHDLNMADDPLPVDFFDLIGGTSTGGLIALLLGRLRLSVPEARKAYVRIAKDVFSVPRYVKKNKFDGQRLEEAVKQLLREQSVGSSGEERMIDPSRPACKAFVCAVPQQDVRARSGPRLFRTYNVRNNPTFDCTVWEASRATSAAPTYFDSIAIGDEGEQETFVDGGLGYNNPIEQVLEEASRIFPGRKVACVVSIGTGLARAIQFPASPKTSPTKLISALTKMATESDTTAEKVQKRFREIKGTYFRFNVDRGLSGIKLEEWENLGDVRTYTTGYMQQDTISSHIDAVVTSLLASKAVPGQDDSTALVRVSTSHSVEMGSSEGRPQMLPWKLPTGPYPDFHLNIETLSMTIVPPPVVISVPKWVVPFERNQDFVGREVILEQLLMIVPPAADEGVCQRTSIQGLGGVGKTQIALEAAFRVRQQHQDCSVFWVPAMDKASIENAYLEIGKSLKVEGLDRDHADIMTLVRAALDQDATNWLLVIDNIDDSSLLFGAAHLAGYLPSNPRGSILLTTRNHNVVHKLAIRQLNRVPLGHMSRAESVKLLHQHLTVEQTRDTKSTTDLLEVLTDLPLAIKQASAYMDQTQTTTTRYLELCRSSDANLVELLSKDFDDHGRYGNMQNPVATTWLVSFHLISRDNPLSIQYLKYLSFLAEKDIPRNLLPTWDNILKMDEALGLLKTYAFISEREGQESYDIHRLVRLAMRNWLTEKPELQWFATELIRTLNTEFPFAEYENRSVWIRYMPHALIALESRQYAADDDAKPGLLESVATAFLEQGRYREAETLYRESLALDTQTLGVDHPSAISSKGNLANALFGQGRYQEAEALYRETLALQTQILGARHPDTIKSNHNLALTLHGQRKLKEAEALHLQTLTLRTEVLGANHQATLMSGAHLGSVLAEQGRHGEAESVHRKVLELQTQIMGPDHPNTLRSNSFIGQLLYKQGRYQEAEAIIREMLELQTQALGADHPDTFWMHTVLVGALFGQKRHQEATAMYRKVLALRTRSLGAGHPDTIRSRLILEQILQSQDNGQGFTIPPEADYESSRSGAIVRRLWRSLETRSRRFISKSPPQTLGGRKSSGS
ncbi:kinesin light chain [Ilyonectria robusta]